MRWLANLLFVFLAACAPSTVDTIFVPADANFINKTGDAAIVGQALVLLPNDRKVYASSTNATLIPSTEYSRDLMAAIFHGKNFAEYVSISGPIDANYVAMVRTTPTDESGYFEFRNVADGDYFVVVPVKWEAGGQLITGRLMEAVSVRGSVRKILLLHRQRYI